MIDDRYIFDCEVFAFDWLFVFKHKTTKEYTVIHNDNEAVRQFMEQEPLWEASIISTMTSSF